MRILLWHVHGSWTTSFVQGDHDYVLPLTPGRDRDGLGRAQSWQWPPRAVEVPHDRLREQDLDVVLLQRPHELELAQRWTGRRPGRDVPALYVEHNTPGGDVPFTRHPLAEQDRVPVVHVTHFNRLFWDCGRAPTDVVEHGVVDPGHLYSGDWARAAVVVNDPVRRGRAVGADLLPLLAEAAPLDVFGMNVHDLADVLDVAPGRLWTFQDLSQARLHREMARRRVYVHTSRWTSLGLSLIEAMHLGMPVVALATTEAVAAVPPDAGVLSTRPAELASAVRRFLHEPSEAQAVGAAAREAALARYGLGRFLADWDARLAAWVSGAAARTGG
jgi:glycosyltransferase involved in cell wall biosynthesis